VGVVDIFVAAGGQQHLDRAGRQESAALPRVQASADKHRSRSVSLRTRTSSWWDACRTGMQDAGIMPSWFMGRAERRAFF
jgi:hypothetical protein